MPNYVALDKTELILPKNFNPQGRILTDGYSRHELPQAHTIRHLIPLERTIPVAGGLFVESAKNSYFIFSLLKKLDFRNFVWGFREFRETKNPDEAFNLLGINYLYHILDEPPSKHSYPLIASNEKIQALTTVGFDHYLYQVSKTSLVQTLDYVPQSVEQNWEETVRAWWAEDKDLRVMVNTKGPVNWQVDESSRLIDFNFFSNNSI